MATDDLGPFANGSTWLRADFHLHTKTDKEFTYSGDENSFVAAYIDGLKKAGIGLGVICNHNKFNADEFKALRKKAKKEGIGLLPGTELSVNDGANGVHIQLYKDIRSGQSSLLQHPDYLTERRASVVLIAGNEDGYFSVKFKTSTAAVLCVNPFDLKEAVAALTDEAWLKSLNCWSVPAGIDVIKIEPVENSQTEPWKVRLRLPNGTGATLWGYIFSFTLPNGNRITY